MKEFIFSAVGSVKISGHLLLFQSATPNTHAGIAERCLENINYLLSSGSIQNLIISVINYAEIIGYKGFLNPHGLIAHVLTTFSLNKLHTKEF
jgi:hypothetical protein